MSNFIYKDTGLYYETQGEKGQPPVLLVHGWGIDHQYLVGCMEPVFSEVSKSYRRYYVDLPGMGQSKPGFVQNGDDIVEVLEAFIQQVLPQEPILLVGNSFGGNIICAIARRMPERVSGMILIAPSTGCRNQILPKYQVWRLEEAFLETLTSKQRDHFTQMNVTLTKEAWEQYEQYLYPAILNNETNDFLNHVLVGVVSDNLFEVEQEKQLMKPVLFLTGKQDNCVGYEDQYRLAKCYPEASFVMLYGAGHNLPFDQPRMFQQAVVAWLETY